MITIQKAGAQIFFFIILYIYTYLYIFILNKILCGERGSTVVKALYYKSENRWFVRSWCRWNLSLTKSFRSHYGPGVELSL